MLRTAAIAPIAEAPQMANPVATSSDTRGGSRKSLLIPYVPAKAASTTAVDEQQRGPAEAQHIAEADLQAQDHDPGPHQVLAGEVQPGPRRPGGPARHARQVGGQQPEQHGHGHRRQRGEQQVDGDGDGDGGRGAGQAGRGSPGQRRQSLGGHAPTLPYPAGKAVTAAVPAGGPG